MAATSSIPEFAGQLAQMFAKVIMDATASWMKFEKQTLTTLRSVGYTGKQLQNINNALIKDAARLGMKYGTTHEELIKIQRSFNDITRTSAEMSSQAKESFATMQKVLGDSAPMEWAKSMHQFGMSAQSANTWLGKSVIQAKALGLNTQQFAQALSEGAKLMNKMNFKTGIDGLTKMTGLATRLGTSVESLTAHIDIDNGKFSTIEGSIEASANLQRLGSTFAANFSNPMEVMAEGMFDAEASMERIVKSLQGKGTFNRATGQVDQGWLDKKTIGIAAQSLGMSPDELRKVANRSVMAGAMEEDMKKGGSYGNLSEKEREAALNLGQYNVQTGKFEISYSDENGNTQTMEIGKLTSEQLSNIIKLTKEEEDINRNVGNIAKNVVKISNAIAGNAASTQSFMEVSEGSRAAYDAWKADKFGQAKITTAAKQGIQSLGADSNGIFNAGLDWFKNMFFGRTNGGIVEATPTGFDKLQKFDTGGVVGGSDYSGDKVITRVNSGEMVLNSSQQARLFNIANSGGGVANAGAQAAAINGLNRALSYIGSPKFLNAWESASTQISSSLTRAVNLVPQNAKQLKNLGKLAKSATIAYHVPTRLFSQSNLFGRFARRKVSKWSPELGNAWQGLTKTAEEIRDIPRQAWEGIKNSRLATHMGQAKEWTVGKASSAYGWTRGKVLRGGEKIAEYASKTTAALTPAAKSVAEFTSKTASKFSSLGKAIADSRLAEGCAKVAKGVGTLGRDVAEFGKGVGRVGGRLVTTTGKLVTQAGKLGKETVKLGGKLAKPIISTAGKVAKPMLQTTAKLASKGISKLDGGITRSATKLLGKNAGKFVKGMGPVGTAVAAGFAAYEGFKAISDFGDMKKDIESRNDLSNKEKKQLIRQTEDTRNEKVGQAAGSVVGMAIGSSLGSVIPGFGTAIGGMVGSFVGEKIGGFLGKNVNNAKDFLFGKKAELSDEDQAQLDYEETKMGQVSIEDPQLMEKAATATCAMHDLLVSIWHHMNGKASNGEEEKKGALSGILKTTASLAFAPFAAIGSLFSGSDDDGDQGKVKDKEKDKEEQAFENVVSENIVNINTNLETFLSNAGNGGVNLLKPKDKTSSFGMAMKAVGISALATVMPAASVMLAKSLHGDLKASETDTEESGIKPQPLGEEAVQVNGSNSQPTVQEPSISDNTTIKLEISGTLKLECNGLTENLDMSRLLKDPAIQNEITNLVVDQINRRTNGGRPNLNTANSVKKVINN